ncbi:hypothetical protein ES702_05366 [subsurface metagenome]
MLLQWKLNIKKVFILVLVSIFSALSLHFVLIILNVYSPLSQNLHNPTHVSEYLYEFLPLALMIFVLFLFKLNRIKDEKIKSYNAIEIGVIITIVVFSIIAVFRFIDICIMIMFATYSYESSMFGTTLVAFHILFYNILSLILLITIVKFFNKDGLKTFLPVLIIPAFYSLNADLIMRATEYSALSFFTPCYNFILEFGRIGILFIGWFLNLFNFGAVVFTETFPFKMFLGGTIYLIDLPCIGWEGLMGYTIIFLNLMVDIEKSKKMRLIWGVLGLIGTIFVNWFRLTLVFVVGKLFDVQAAMLIHQHLGDVIFVIWIFTFIIFIDKIKTAKIIRVFDRLITLLNRS